MLRKAKDEAYIVRDAFEKDLHYLITCGNVPEFYALNNFKLDLLNDKSNNGIQVDVAGCKETGFNITAYPPQYEEKAYNLLENLWNLRTCYLISACDFKASAIKNLDTNKLENIVKSCSHGLSDSIGNTLNAVGMKDAADSLTNHTTNINKETSKILNEITPLCNARKTTKTERLKLFVTGQETFENLVYKETTICKKPLIRRFNTLVDDMDYICNSVIDAVHIALAGQDAEKKVPEDAAAIK